MKFPLFVVYLSIVVAAEDELYGDIQTCGVQYVKPGDQFQIECRSDHAALTTVGH